MGGREVCEGCVNGLWSSISSFLSLLYDGGSCSLGHWCPWGHNEEKLERSTPQLSPFLPHSLALSNTSCFSDCSVLQRGFNVYFQRPGMNLQIFLWIYSSSSCFQVNAKPSFLEFPCVLQGQQEKYLTLWKLRSMILRLQGGLLKFRNTFWNMGNSGENSLQSILICLFWDRKMLGRNIVCFFCPYTFPYIASYHDHCWEQNGGLDGPLVWLHIAGSMLWCYGKMRTSTPMLLASKAIYAFSNLTLTFPLYPCYYSYVYLHSFLIVLLIYCIFTYFRYSASASKGGLQLLPFFPLRKHMKLFLFEELFSK